MSLKKCILLAILPLALNAETLSVSQLFNVKTVAPKTIQSAQIKHFFGYTAVDESRVVDVSPRFGGFVEVLYADRHFQKVKKGEVLVKVYSPEVLQAKEDYLNAYRYNSSRSSKAMLRSAREKLVLLGVNKSEIDAISKNRKVNSYTTLVSPIDGYIFMKNVNKGSAFKTGKKLFEIVNLDVIWVEAKIYTSSLLELPTFKEYKVQIDGQKVTQIAKLEKLLEKVDTKEATATLRLSIENKDNTILPGLYSKIKASSDKANLLVLPRTAVMRKNNKFYVFKAGEYEGEYEPSVVAVKPLNSKQFIIVSGLEESEKVVDNALFMMDSDAQVNGLY